MTDGPGGDSALVVADGTARLVNQNDCRLHDPGALSRHGPVDMQWLQYSGAIWYPMVYELPDDDRRELAVAKVESQFARAVRYVEAVGARVVVPSAGPPCFLDPELAGLNVVTGDEISIFPDAPVFLERLAKEGIETGVLAVPGTSIDVDPAAVTVAPPHGRRRRGRDLHRQGRPPPPLPRRLGGVAGRRAGVVAGTPARPGRAAGGLVGAAAGGGTVAAGGRRRGVPDPQRRRVRARRLPGRHRAPVRR